MMVQCLRSQTQVWEKNKSLVLNMLNLRNLWDTWGRMSSRTNRLEESFRQGVKIWDSLANRWYDDIGWEILRKEYKVRKSKVWEQTKECHIWRDDKERSLWRSLKSWRGRKETRRGVSTLKVWQHFKQFLYKCGARSAWKLYWGMKKAWTSPSNPDGVGKMNNFYLRDCRRSCSFLQGKLCLNLRQGGKWSEISLRKERVFLYYRRRFQRIQF